MKPLAGEHGFPAYFLTWIVSTSSGVRRTPGTLQSTAIVNHGANPGMVSYLVKQALLDIAEKCDLRLNRKFHRMTSRGKRSTVAAVAVARELMGFIWAIGQTLNP